VHPLKFSDSTVRVGEHQPAAWASEDSGVEGRARCVGAAEKTNRSQRWDVSGSIVRGCQRSGSP
jgi:hypothetical protein